MTYFWAALVLFLVISASIVLGLCRSAARADEIQDRLMHERDNEIRSVEGK